LHIAIDARRGAVLPTVVTAFRFRDDVITRAASMGASARLTIGPAAAVRARLLAQLVTPAVLAEAPALECDGLQEPTHDFSGLFRTLVIPPSFSHSWCVFGGTVRWQSGQVIADVENT
jgi:hypothetical protein